MAIVMQFARIFKDYLKYCGLVTFMTRIASYDFSNRRSKNSKL